MHITKHKPIKMEINDYEASIFVREAENALYMLQRTLKI